MKDFTLILLLAILGIWLPAQGAEPATIADSLPGQWIPQRLFDQTLPAEDEWWDALNDPILTQLIKKGQENNYNVLEAMRRIRIAANTYKSATAGYFPSLNLAAGWNAQRESGKTSKKYMETATADYFSLGLSMQWEIDVFGRIYTQRKADKAALDVSRADYDATMVSLASNIGKAYVNLRVAQERLKVAEAHISSQEHVAKITEVRKETGLASGLDVSQAQQVLLSTKASIPTLRSSITAAINSLAVLTGQFPQQISEMLLPGAPLPNTSRIVPVGIPADMLRRRPDVAAAEYELSEYAAQIGIAKKDWLPTLSLSATAGTDAHRFDNLFSGHSFGWSVAPQLSWTIFDGLARNYKINDAKLQLEAGIDNYNIVILTAYQEVENAMANYAAAIDAVDLDQAVVKQCDKTLSLSLDLYKQGLTSFTDVANAQISSLEAQTSLLEARGTVLTSLITLYQALGGGYTPSK